MRRGEANWRHLALAALLATGITVGWACLWSWLVTVMASWQSPGQTWEHLGADLVGTPFIRSFVHGTFVKIHDLAGRAAGDITEIRQLNSAVLSPHFGSPRNPERFGFFSSSDSNAPPANWYLVVDNRDPQRRGHFVGYDSYSKLVVGHISKRGFSTSQPPLEDNFSFPRSSGYSSLPACGGSGGYLEFGEPQHSLNAFQPPKDAQRFSDWMVFLIAGDELWEVDLQQRAARSIHQEPGMLEVALCEQALAELPAPEAVWLAFPSHRLVVRKQDAILLFDFKRSLVNRLPIRAEARDKYLEFVATRDNGGLIFQHLQPFVQDDSAYEVFQQAGDGALTLLGEVNLIKPVNRFAELKRSPFFTTMLAPVPIAQMVSVLWKLPQQLMEFQQAESYLDAVRQVLSSQWPVIAVIFLLAAACTWQCVRHERRYGRSADWRWLALVFLGGPAGYLGYLFHRAWPVRQSCSACGQIVPRDREACAACQAEFQGASPRGVEVFA